MGTDTDATDAGDEARSSLADCRRYSKSQVADHGSSCSEDDRPDGEATSVGSEAIPVPPEAIPVGSKAACDTPSGSETTSEGS